MGTKNRSRLLDLAVYFAVRVGVCVLQMVSFQQARGVARVLAHVVYWVDKRHRNVALENLRQALPGKYSDAQFRRMVYEVYSHYLQLAMEIFLIPRKLRIHNYKNYVTLVHKYTMVDTLLSDRPLLIVTCHFGNWELAGVFLGLTGFTTYAIARTLDNPYLEDFFRKYRETTGQRIVAKKGDYDQIEEVLATGGVMATLGDQDAGKRGVFVDFFGRPASTHKAVALMAMEYDVMMAVCGTRKVGEPLRYFIECEDLIDPRDYAGRPDAVTAITQRFTSAIERLARQAPEQYFWLHNRWKTQPKPKAKAKPAKHAA